jgi:aspartyl-tRNA(Asn)/glutamyl-tRNA(Gln) amidotransferase subunit C
MRKERGAKFLITKKIIEHIAELAKLEIESEEEKEELSVQIDKIIKYFDKLKELDTTDVEIMEYLNGDHENNENFLRDDVVGESYTLEDVLSMTCKKENGYFIVPKVIE